MDILSPLPHVSNVRFRQAIKKYFYKDIEPEYTQQIKDLIVGGAAETLDTLKELADALDNDSEFYTTVTTRFNELQQTVEDNELVTSAALNDLNTRTSTIEEKIPEIDEVLQGKANTNSLATVATSGSYNDLSNKPTIPTVPTNVSEFNNDAGYLTSHQDISGKVDKVEGKGLSTNDFTTEEKEKLASLQNYDDSACEKKLEIVAASGTELSAEVGKYYRFDNIVNTLAITLPTVTDISNILLFFTAGGNPSVTITSELPIVYQEDFVIDGGVTYEINCLFNGTKWVVAQMSIFVG